MESFRVEETERMEEGEEWRGAQRRGRRGHGGGLTACECGLTSPPRLQVLSAGLEAGGKIKPRNVNLFSIVTVELEQKKSA